MRKYKRGGSLKLSGAGYKGRGSLKLSGAGAYGGSSADPKLFKGSGWMTGVGSTLVALGGLGAAGHVGTSSAPQGILGGAVLGGIGGLLIHLDKKKGKGAQMSGEGMKKIIESKMKAHIKKALKNMPHHIVGSGGQYGSGAISKKHIVDFIKSHQHKPIHAKDIFGKDWKAKGKQLIAAIRKGYEAHKKGGEMEMEGEGIFDDIGHGIKSAVHKVGSVAKKVGTTVYHEAKEVRDKAYHKLIEFGEGKTKFKPSQLLSYSAAAVGALGAASALIPGVDIISVPTASAAALGLKSAGLALKTSGRGQLAKKLPKRILDIIRKDPHQAKKALDKARRDKGKGIVKSVALTAGALTLYGFLKENPHLLSQTANAITKYITGSGGGVALAGGTNGDIPKAAMNVVNVLYRQAGPDLSKSKVGLAIGLTGAALTGAYALYKKLGKEWKGKGGGVTLTGGQMGIPAKIQKYMEKHPAVAKKMAKLAKSKKGGEYRGRGTASKILAALGIAGTSAAAGAYGVYQYLLANPTVAAKIAAKGTASILGLGQYGLEEKIKRKAKKGGAVHPDEILGKKLPYGVSRTAGGKIKRDRYSVWHGYHKSTPYGLTKSDLMLKGRKVISKRKHQIGMGMVKAGKGLYK